MNLLAAETASGFPILPALVLVPLVGALAVLCVPRARTELHRMTAIVSSVATAALSIWLLIAFETGEAGFQFVVSRSWVSEFDIKFYFGVDGISLFLVVLTGVLFPLAMFASKPEHDEKGYWFWLALLEVGCMGAFVALDLVLFFLFFELTLVPLYFLIGRWGHGRRVYAATKFFLFTMLGSAFMLVSIVVLALLAHAGPDGGVSFDLLKVAASDSIARTTGRWLFLGFAAAFMVKTPVFPFHTWLPDAHTEAPTAGSVILAGILLKLGTYGFLRYGLFLFPEATVWLAPVMMTLGTVGIIYTAIVAAMQRNFKRLIAYTSVAHMGFAILGLFALSTQAVTGSVVVMINHGISTGALFILLGYLYERRHTYDFKSLRGIQRVAPWFAGAFTLVMFSSIGVPGLNGFVGEFLVLVGTFVTHRWWAVVAASGVIFAALYLLWGYQQAFHGPVDEDNSSFRDLGIGEKLVMVPLIALIVFLGVYPKPVLDRIEPSVNLVLEHVREVNERTRPDEDIPVSISASSVDGRTDGAPVDAVEEGR